MPKPKNDDLIEMNHIPDLIYELTGVRRMQATVYSWARKGRINCHGQLVRLKTYKRLGQLYTTVDAVKSFLLELG